MSTRFRVDWKPGSDVLRGTCFCGAASSAQDPATLLDWLDGHPDGHDAGAALPAPDAAPASLAEVGGG